MSLTLTLKDNGGNPVSGEGTSITLNNTTETNFTKFDLYGDTNQSTYSGRNLFDKSAITANVLVSRDTGATLGNSNFSASDYIPIEEGQQYTFTNGFDRWYSAFYDSSKQYVGYPTNTQVITVPTGAKYIRLSVYNSFLDTAQFEKGNQATSYEPYVGGTASPNPDYPQEVQTVTGEQTITVSNGQGESQVYPIDLGKNLYFGSPSFDLFVGISGWVDGGTYNNMPVIKRAGSWNGTYKLVGIEAGNTYTFSLWIKSDEARQVAIYAVGGSTSATATISPNSKTITTTTSWERVSFTFDCTASGTVGLRTENTSSSETNYTYISGFQLEKGSTATNYDPYIQAFGKNLLNPATLTADGRLNADGTVLSGATGFSTSDYIPVEPNTTYTITRNAASSGFFGNLCQYNSNMTKIGNREYWDNSTTWPYHTTTSEDTHYIRVSDQTTLFGTSFQIEKGSSATTYKPNISGQLELCEIGDYQDYLYKSEGNWYVHKEIGKSLIDGTQGTVQRITTNRFNVSGFPTGYKMQKLANFSLADKYQTVVQYDTNGDFDSGTSSMNYAFGFHPTSSGVRIKDTRYNTVDDYKTWLATNPIIVYYALANQTDTQITYEPLVAQLDALYNTAHSYNGATIVTSSSQYLPAIMDVTIGASTNEVTYIETELSNPLTITDIEGKSQNTTLNGNIYVDYVYNKKSFSVSIFNLKSADYATIRGFYDRQFTLNEFPLLSIPELNISEMPVFFEIGSREINSQCIVTDKLTLKFRETAQQ